MTGAAVNQSPGMNEREGVVERAINEIVQRVSEWDDRTSPEDWPEAMLITADELRDELRGLASVLAPAPSAWQPENPSPVQTIPLPLWAAEDLLKWMPKVRERRDALYPIGLENLLRALVASLPSSDRGGVG